MHLEGCQNGERCASVVRHGSEKSTEVKDPALVLSRGAFEFHLQLGLSYQTHLRAGFQMERVTLYPPNSDWMSVHCDVVSVLCDAHELLS